jgi:hypothetical protein
MTLDDILLFENIQIRRLPNNPQGHSAIKLQHNDNIIENARQNFEKGAIVCRK